MAISTIIKINIMSNKMRNFKVLKEQLHDYIRRRTTHE